MDSGLELGDSFESCFDLDNLPENITKTTSRQLTVFREKTRNYREDKRYVL